MSVACARGALRRLAMVGLMGLALGGCNAARTFVATPNDYADYRRVRLGRTLDERLAAAWAYLKERPDGRYHARLKAYFEGAEPLYFKVRRRTAPGLEAYLGALPDGPHAAESLGELMGLRNESRREALASRATRATILRIAREEKSREKARGMVEWWIRAMLDPAPWRGTFSDAPAEVLVRFRLSAPEPKCAPVGEGQRCTKASSQAFRVRGPAGELDAKLNVKLEILLDRDYRLVELRLEGVDFALHAEEAGAGMLATSAPGAAEAAWRALLSRIALGVVNDSRTCNGGEDAAGGLRLDCDDPQVTLVASRESDGSESVVFARKRAEP